MGTPRDELKPFASAQNLRAALETTVSFAGALLSVFASIYFFTSALWLPYGIVTFLGALFFVKIFTIQHDCGHSSMFSSETANTWVGRMCSVFTTMPFSAWKLNHDLHHHSIANLSKTGIGDTALMTVADFKKARPLTRFGYRLVRNPLIHLIVSPFFYFFISFKIVHLWWAEYRSSTALNDVAVLSAFVAFGYFFGFSTMFFVLAPFVYLGGIVGLILFYLQHNFPGMRWFTDDEWNYEEAARISSSLIILPQPLEWFTQAIGYHHVHHLDSRIPGYRLREAYDAMPFLRETKPLSLGDAFYSFRLKLWSFEKGRLVTYKEAEVLSR